jgi:D-alanyl-D-alanine dipeptidase
MRKSASFAGLVLGAGVLAGLAAGRARAGDTLAGDPLAREPGAGVRGRIEAGAKAAPAGLPAGFVRLLAIAPGIRQDMRYATADNFTGARVAGYEAGTCILARPVAEALRRVHERLSTDGYGLKVFDCYRPARAVKAFMMWADGGAGTGLPAYFPRIARSQVIPLGYVATRSSHSLGTAVDLTLVHLAGAKVAGGAGALASPSADGASRAAAGAPEATRADGSKSAGGGDNESATCLDATRFNRDPDEVDMGTAFDCFDVRSHTHTRAVSAAQRASRRRLLEAMSRAGFRNYKREWWHFSLPADGFGKTRDFQVR